MIHSLQGDWMPDHQPGKPDRSEIDAMGAAEGGITPANAQDVAASGTTTGSAHYWKELGRAALQSKDFPRALHCCRQAFLIDPTDSYTLERIGELEFALGQARQAATRYDELIRRQPQVPRYRYRLFSLLQRKAAMPTRSICSKILWTSCALRWPYIFSRYGCSSTGFPSAMPPRTGIAPKACITRG
jgi:tetratricopeptide (TPR) repeat protein